jgi:hypothetical protein
MQGFFFFLEKLLFVGQQIDCDKNEEYNGDDSVHREESCVQAPHVSGRYDEMLVEQ